MGRPAFQQGLDRRGQNRRALVEWVRGALVEGVDFGSVQTKRGLSKPSLFKPGSEKICGMLGVTAVFPTLSRYEDAALAGVSIEYFTTDSEFIKPGDNVILFWSVRGADQAHIYRVDEQGERIWRWDVDSLGKLTVSTRPQDRDIARFVLAVQSDGEEIEQPLLIPMQCPEVWYFDPPPLVGSDESGRRLFGARTRSWEIPMSPCAGNGEARAW